MATAPRRVGAENSATRALILDATEQLIREEGYAAVSTRRVAARAGLKPSLVHYYFTTTDDLLLAMSRRGAEESDRMIEEALRSDDPVRGLPPFGDEVARPTRRNWPTAAMAMVLGLAGLVRLVVPVAATQHLGDSTGVAVALPVAAASTDEPASEAWTEEGAASVEPLAESPPPASEASEATRKREPRRRGLPEQLGPEALMAGFAAVEGAVSACRRHGGMAGMVVHVQLTVTAAGKVEGASARKPYQGTSLGRCVEAEASRASFPRARAGQRAEPGFKL